MPAATQPPDAEHPETEAPIRLLPPRLVALDPEREQLAVSLLAELLAQFIEQPRA